MKKKVIAPRQNENEKLFFFLSRYNYDPPVFSHILFFPCQSKAKKRDTISQKQKILYV